MESTNFEILNPNFPAIPNVARLIAVSIKLAIILTTDTTVFTKKPAIPLNKLITLSNKLFPPILIIPSFSAITPFSRATTSFPDLNRNGRTFSKRGIAGFNTIFNTSEACVISIAERRLNTIEKYSPLYNEIRADSTFATISIGKPAHVNGTSPIISRTRRKILRPISTGSGSLTRLAKKSPIEPNKLSFKVSIVSKYDSLIRNSIVS